MTHTPRSRGFTIIEIALVLIVLGILAAVLVPMAQVVHDDSMRETDQATMEVAKNALMGYIRINEGIPCLDAAGNQITPDYTAVPPVVCDPTATLDLLGVRTTDARGRTFAFDVNEWLTLDHITNVGPSICGALADIIELADPTTPPPATVPPLDPQVCDSTNANTGATACVLATPRPMAFMLVGRGSDRCLNLENTHASAANDAVCTTAVAANRTFENPARIHSRTTDDGYYDDLVFTLTPLELAEAMGCPAGGGGGSAFTLCPANEALVQVSNGDNSWLSIGAGGSCYQIAAGTTASMGCQPDGDTISLHSNASCGTVIVSNTLANLDTNNDGRADIVCDNTAVCTWR
jgi:prepilin-type N-terminal cleavage/methylation domain-containing protein